MHFPCVLFTLQQIEILHIHIYGKRQWQTKRTRSMMQWLRMVQPRIRSGPRSFLGGGSGTGLATPSGNCEWESPQSLPTISSMMTASIPWAQETEDSKDMMQSSRQEQTGAHDEAIRAWRARSLHSAGQWKLKAELPRKKTQFDVNEWAYKQCNVQDTQSKTYERRCFNYDWRNGCRTMIS